MNDGRVQANLLERVLHCDDVIGRERARDEKEHEANRHEHDFGAAFVPFVGSADLL